MQEYLYEVFKPKFLKILKIKTYILYGKNAIWIEYNQLPYLFCRIKIFLSDNLQ